MEPARDIARLIEIMAALRQPEDGCPWDIEQTFDSIVPYTLEEAYEVADAIQRRDPEDLREELGDLLLQVVYHAQMATEADLFTFDDVVLGITTKMVRRHPHVFGDAEARNARSAKGQWERIKAEERAEKASRRAERAAAVERPTTGGEWRPKPPSRAPRLLDAVPSAFPALTEALKVQEKAAKVGFDWDRAADIEAKIDEERAELDAALAAGDRAAASEEFGDVLFSLVNLGRFHELDSEAALRGCTRKFRSRFGHIEARLVASGRTLQDASLAEMEALWLEAKTRARAEDGEAYDDAATTTSG